jgi:hypothetical protein
MRPLSPIEVAQVFDVALAKGSTFRDVAAAVGFESESTLREIHRLLNLAPEIQHLVGWPSGSPLSMTSASQIARLVSNEDQKAVAEAVLVEALTADETRQVAQAKLRSPCSIEEAIDAILRLRPKVQRKDLLVGAITSDTVRDHLSRMSQRERDELLRETISDCFGQLPAWTGSLGAARFSLLGDRTFGNALRSLPSGFEAAVNSCLETKVDKR